MPELDGIEATRRILARDHEPNARADPDHLRPRRIRIRRAARWRQRLPAQGRARAAVVAGIRTVGDGDALLAPSITRRLIEEFAAARTAPTTSAGLDELTPRELEVFRLLATGLTNVEIAQQLIVAETTVKTHVTRILMKLGVRDRVQAVVLAYETGLAIPGRTPPGLRPPDSRWNGA